MARSGIEKRLRLASLLVALGLFVALVSMFWNHPLSFMVFLIIGMPITAGGALIYLLSIVSPPRDGLSS